MRVFGWIKVARRLAPTLLQRWGRNRVSPARRGMAPSLESLERIDLLSRAGFGLGFPMSRPVPTAAEVGSISPLSVEVKGVSAAQSATQSTSAQSAVVPETLTNFNLPFAPPIDLFDASLGELVAVKLSATASLNSRIISQNTSTTSGADITGFTNGTFSINGLPTPINGTLNGTTDTVSVPPFAGGNPDFTGPSTVEFPPLTVTNSQSITYNSAADLAFFTSAPGRTTITPTLVAQAQSGATAPNGNLQTDVRTFGSGELTVVYEYLPNCPTIVKLVRFGIHHQPTKLQITFEGPVDPVEAEDVNNYRILLPGGRYSPDGTGRTFSTVSSAVYNPADNTVLLTTTRRLNVHHQYVLEVNLPCNGDDTVYVQFGGKRSLGGFWGHRGQFVPFPRGWVVRR